MPMNNRPWMRDAAEQLAQQQTAPTDDDWFAANGPQVVQKGYSTFLNTNRGANFAHGARPAPAVPRNQGGGGDLTSWWNSGDPQGSIMGLVQKLGLSPGNESMPALQPYLQAVGGRLENPNAMGITSKVILPGMGAVRIGGFFDGGGTPDWTFVPQGGGGGGGGEGGGDEYNPNAPLYAPFTEEFKYKDFEAPDPNKIKEDATYQFRLGEGNDQLQNSAAARGTYFSPNTMEGLQKFGQRLASEEYQNLYDRSLTDYKTNYEKTLTEWEKKYGVFEGNQAKAFNRLYQTSGIGSNAAGQMGSLGSSAGANLGQTLKSGTEKVNSEKQGGVDTTASASLSGRRVWSNLAGRIGNAAGQWGQERRNRTTQPMNG